MNIIEAFTDKNLFGSLVKDQKTWANWRIFLKTAFALPMDEADLAAYRQYTGRSTPPQAPFSEIFAIVGRRGGKSFIAAVTACYLALFRDWRQYLSPGETGWVMVLATDRRQAKVILGYIKAILALPIFKSLRVKELDEEVQLSNQISISVKTCDFRTLRGFTIVAAVCDEIAFWRSEGANPSAEILTALRPSLATVPGSLLLGISSPYSKTGPLYESFRDKWGQDDPETLVWRAPTLAMNPTIRASIIERALKADYSAAKSEWLAEFRDDLETFLSTEIIEQAVIRGRYELPAVTGQAYVGFVDVSGGRVDSATMGIAHVDRQTKRVVMDRLEERRPPFAPADVCREFAQIFKQYNVTRIEGDRYAGEFPVRAFKDEGVALVASKLDRSSIYLEFEPLLAQGQVELLDNKTLFSQLRGLERSTRSSGKDRVDHYPGGKDDVANSCAGAAVLAASTGSRERKFWVIDTTPRPANSLRQFLGQE